TITSPFLSNRWMCSGSRSKVTISPTRTRLSPRSEAARRSPDSSAPWTIVSAPRISHDSTRSKRSGVGEDQILGSYAKQRGVEGAFSPRRDTHVALVEDELGRNVALRGPDRSEPIHLRR